MKKVLGILVVVSLLLAFGLTSLQAQEAKKVYVKARPPYSFDDMDYMGAITFIGKDRGYLLETIGGSSDPTSAIISGFNHDMTGALVGTGDRAGIATDENALLISESNIVIEGDPAKDTELNFTDDVYDMEALVAYLKKKADITYTTDTSLTTEDSIGSPTDFKLVYVDNADLTLTDEFVGYGLLAIYDQDADGLRLVLQNSAQWIGVVVVFQYDAVGLEKTYISLEGSTSGTGVSDIGDYVLYAINSMSIGNNLRVQSGSLGVHSSTGTMTIDNNLSTQTDCSLAANSINLGNNATIRGDIYRNSLTHGVNYYLAGTDYNPVTFPLLTLPSFPSFSAGTLDLIYGNNATAEVAPGDYRDIEFQNNGTLIFTGGVYNVRSISMENNGRVLFRAPTELRITTDFYIKNNPQVKPEPGSGLDASDIVIYYSGTNTFDAKNNAYWECNVYAPYAQFYVKNNATFKGAFIGQTIATENNAGCDLYCDSAFGPGSSQVTTPKIIGAVVLEGREFKIPYTHPNNQILFSQEAVSAVNDLIRRKEGFIWEDWKRVE